jgi:fatty acid desaturase
MRRQQRLIWNDFCAQTVWLVVIQFAIIVFNWKRFILFWYIPRVWASIAITTMNFLQHDGCDVIKTRFKKKTSDIDQDVDTMDEKAQCELDENSAKTSRNVTKVSNTTSKYLKDESVNTSRNFTGWFTNLIYFNNGFHSVHHLFPTMHWSELPKAHKKLYHSKITSSLEQDNMQLYIWKTYIYPGKLNLTQEKGLCMMVNLIKE